MPLYRISHSSTVSQIKPVMHLIEKSFLQTV